MTIKYLLHKQNPKTQFIQQQFKMECPICYDIISAEGEKCLVTLGCGHNYCMDCLYQSMKNNNQCPMCRHQLYNANINDADDDEEEEEDDTDSDDTDSDDDEDEDDENATVIAEPEIERNEFELDAQQQFYGLSEHQVNNIPELYLETIYERMVAHGMTMMDVLCMHYSGLNSSIEKYNTKRKRRNIDIKMNNIVFDLDNQILEEYAMGLEDVRV